MAQDVFIIREILSAAAFERLQGQVVSATEAGAREITLALDEIPALDSAAIRQLIKLLRRTRELGGDIALAVSRADLLRTLRVTALDKVFTVVPVPEAAA